MQKREKRGCLGPIRALGPQQIKKKRKYSWQYMQYYNSLEDLRDSTSLPHEESLGRLVWHFDSCSESSKLKCLLTVPLP